MIRPGLDIAEVPHSIAEQEIAPDDKGKEDVAKDDDQEKDLKNGGILPIATTGVCLRADWDFSSAFTSMAISPLSSFPFCVVASSMFSINHSY